MEKLNRNSALKNKKAMGRTNKGAGEWYFEDKYFGMNSRYRKLKASPVKPDRYITYDNAKELSEKIGDIGKGERCFCFTNGNSSMSDFLEAFIVERNLHIKCLKILNPSISLDGIQSLVNLIEGDFVEKIDLALSEDFRKTDMRPGGIIPILYDGLDIENRVQIAFVGSHAKIIAFETFDGLFFVFHGSANLRSNRNLEQFHVEENEELYSFNATIIDSIMAEFFTICHEKNYICSRDGVMQAYEGISKIRVDSEVTKRKAIEAMNKIPLKSVRGHAIWQPILLGLQNWKPSRFNQNNKSEWHQKEKEKPNDYPNL